LFQPKLVKSSQNSTSRLQPYTELYTTVRKLYNASPISTKRYNISHFLQTYTKLCNIFQNIKIQYRTQLFKVLHNFYKKQTSQIFTKNTKTVHNSTQLLQTTLRHFIKLVKDHTQINKYSILHNCTQLYKSLPKLYKGLQHSAKKKKLFNTFTTTRTKLYTTSPNSTKNTPQLNTTMHKSTSKYNNLQHFTKLFIIFKQNFNKSFQYTNKHQKYRSTKT